MKPAFSKFLQIGIIVRNVDEAVKYYEETLGMGPWEVSFMSGENPPATDLTINGEARHDVISKMAFMHAYGFEFELIEPVGDSPYKKHLEEFGPGIHHIAVVTADQYDDVLKNYKEKTGRDPWIRGVGIGGMMDFSYLDYREEMGLIVETYRHLAPGKIGIDYNYPGEDVTK